MLLVQSHFNLNKPINTYRVMHHFKQFRFYFGITLAIRYCLILMLKTITKQMRYWARVLLLDLFMFTKVFNIKYTRSYPTQTTLIRIYFKDYIVKTLCFVFDIAIRKDADSGIRFTMIFIKRKFMKRCKHYFTASAVRIPDVSHKQTNSFSAGQLSSNVDIIAKNISTFFSTQFI